ncbi:Zinc metalloproteinase nas-7 [Diplonema papillatum]|nr:Zinc metalloproteinase nas-7 [Diplonema papillatum]
MSFIRGLLAVVLGTACAAEETLNTEGPHGAPYVLDGDIQVPVDEYLNRHADALGAEWGGKSRRWAGGKVRYAIATNYTNPFQPAEYYLADDNPNIAWAVAHIEEKTCIRMSKCDSPFTCETPFIVFVSTFDTCSSPLGNTGGINQINLDIGCNRGTVVHEIYHSLGVQHEQKRRDRDEYVFVNMSNVLTKPVDRRFQFYKLFGGRDLGPYDYGSIMHYGSAFFHIDPAYPTIVAPLPIGQSTALSQGDIDTIQFMYNECSDEFEAPVCMANKDEDTVYEARSNLPFSVQFSVEWEAGGTVTVDYALTTTPEFTTLAAQGSSMGDSSNTEIFFTPSDSTVGNTYTMGATFTANTDAAPSTTCSITVKVVQVVCQVPQMAPEETAVL